MTDWDIIHTKALKCYESNTVWPSLGGNVEYKVGKITPTKISMIRLNGGNDEDINKVGVNRAIARLRELGEVPQQELMGDVIRQTALVFFHPSVRFNKKKA